MNCYIMFCISCFFQLCMINILRLYVLHHSLIHQSNGLCYACYCCLMGLIFHQGNIIATPAIKGTILPGITRKSIIDVALSKGFQVNYESIPQSKNAMVYCMFVQQISVQCLCFDKLALDQDSGSETKHANLVPRSIYSCFLL